MTLEQLRIFSVVAELQHFTRAAEALHLSQSAVSASIATLESRFGISLFHRVGRRVELNPAGLAFLQEAREILARARTAEQVLTDLAGLKRGRLVIQASLTIVSHWLPRFIVRFRQHYPGIDIQVHVANTLRTSKSIMDGEAELGFVEGAVNEPTLSCTTIGWDRLLIVAGSGHPWAKLRTLLPEQLLEGEWVLREPGSGTRSAFEAALRAMDLDVGRLKIVQEMPSNGATLEAALNSQWVTATSERLAQPLIQNGAIKPIDFELPRRPFLLLRHKQRYSSSAAQAFIDMIKADPSA